MHADAPDPRDTFAALADAVCTVPAALATAREDVRVQLYLQAESSDFARFNRARVRQLTHVEQADATVTLVQGRRRLAASTTLTGRLDIDRTNLVALREALAADLPQVPDDPFLRLPQDLVDSVRDEPPAPGDLPPVTAIVDDLLASAGDSDLVGFYAAGPMIRAFADSRGQRNWHRVARFHLDWSLYLADAPARRDAAVKSSWAGTRWSPAVLADRMAAARERAVLLARPPRTIPPGAYRAYLEPMAVAELLQTLAWGGFGEKERRNGTSTLAALARGEVAVAPVVRLADATADGIAPAFTTDGERLADRIALIEHGGSAGTLVSPRSGVEFGLPPNADAGEYPSSLALGGGALPASDALAALGDGVWIGNLWYLGYSDRQSCRMTGMTRFACFLVEGGEIVAPITPMRFDDAWPRLFGPALVALTDRPEFLPSGDTWGHRHLASVTTPGALFADLRFTL